MDSHFASPERVSGDTLADQVRSTSENPLVDTIMKVVGGVVAVLNEHRQILAINQALLELFGIGDAIAVLGLRPGEAIGCIHAQEMPAGCGTSEFCRTCGAAIAMVTSLSDSRPVSKNCALAVERHGRREDLYLRVSACPMAFGERRLLMLFLQDITHQQKWAALERMFFHDINNLVTGLLGNSEMLLATGCEDDQELAHDIIKLSRRLAKEVAIQNSLSRTELNAYQPVFSTVMVREILGEARAAFANHPAARNKRIEYPDPAPDLAVQTDFPLFMRVFANMLMNALEASGEGEAVQVWLEQGEGMITFCVRNSQSIPPDVAKRIFQRNFSTKEERGRGLGTYCMKLIGEQVLSGDVSFDSSAEGGTVFRFTQRAVSPATDSAP